MAFLLNSKNVSKYLLERGLCTHKEIQQSRIEPRIGKNFNLLVSIGENRGLFVKQERHDHQGKTAGEFLNEWRIHEFLRNFPELSHILDWLPQALDFDARHSIITFTYLGNHQDLLHTYQKKQIFPAEVASVLGVILATIHRATFNREKYKEFFRHAGNGLPAMAVTKLISPAERISPEIFGLVPADGLRFFQLYQRYDSLGRAIAELTSTFTPCCVTHNDLKLNNILLRDDWEQAGGSVLRLIDWERSGWGDPAFDLGTVLGGYIQLWLSSLIVSKALSLEESLRLAATPLEQLQPSMVSLTRAYLDTFPQIVERRADFLRRTLQFAGLVLIQQIQAMIQYQKYFGNTGICMLQVGKSLLCRPEQSMAVVFGSVAAERFPFARPAA